MKGSFFKRGSKWSYVVDIGIDALTGKRKQMTKGGFLTKKEAQEHCANVIIDLSSGTFAKPNKLTVEQFLNEWLISKKTSIRESTYTSYAYIVKSIISKIGKEKVADISTKKISNLYNGFYAQYSSNRLADIHKVLKMAFSQAKSINEIKVNPMDHVKKPKATNVEFKVWNQQQAQTFLVTIKEKPLYTIFHLALTTGMRQSEILALKWENVNFNEGSIEVVQRLTHDGKKIDNYLKTSSSRRQIALDNNTLQILKNENKAFDLVFCTVNGTPINPRNLMRSFYNYIKLADVPKITFHDLRHTHATLLLQENVNPKVVAERLGHANMRITLERYSHVLPHMQKSAAEKINNFF
jgi:integrase